MMGVLVLSLLSTPFNKRKINNRYIYSYVSYHRAEKLPHIEIVSEYKFNQTNKGSNQKNNSYEFSQH